MLFSWLLSHPPPVSLNSLAVLATDYFKIAELPLLNKDFYVWWHPGYLLLSDQLGVVNFVSDALLV